MRETIALISQRFEAPKTWLGSDDVNVLKILCDLLFFVEQMNKEIALHVHGATPSPSNASIFIANAQLSRDSECSNEIYYSLSSSLKNVIGRYRLLKLFTEKVNRDGK